MEIKAFQLGQRVNLKELQKADLFQNVAKDPHVYKLAPQSWMVVFRYGVVVFWNTKTGEEFKLMQQVRRFVENPLEEPNFEILELKVHKKKQGMMDGVFYLQELTLPTQQLISVVLARSVVLEFFEKQAEKTLTEFSANIEAFSKKGSIPDTSKSLLKRVGTTMQIKNSAVTQMAMLDKPDFTWDDPYLDLLYEQLGFEYEIADRYEILKEKLDTMFEDSEFILNYLEARRSYILEFVIVVLIVIEIVLFFFE